MLIKNAKSGGEELVIDQMGREVLLPIQPKKIVSLVPSQTEFLANIGAPVVGRTKFCLYPKELTKNSIVVGGTKNFRFDTIDSLNPDLIIGNKEENDQKSIERLADSYPVWMSDIQSLEDAFNMMTAIGEICGLEDPAKGVIDECKSALKKVKDTKYGKAIYMIWQDPWMAAGRNTFIDAMLSFLGYENAVIAERYPILSEDDIELMNPEYILLSSEPYPFKERDLQKLSKKWPNATCELVDGELYSWYGSRLSHWADKEVQLPK